MNNKIFLSYIYKLGILPRSFFPRTFLPSDFFSSDFFTRDFFLMTFLSRTFLPRFPFYSLIEWNFRSNVIIQLRYLVCVKGGLFDPIDLIVIR
jgi:hypothetical protein